MLIPVNLTSSSSSSGGSLPPQLAPFGSDELILIEMQGTLETDSKRAGMMVGTLDIDDRTKKSTLRIGHHLLEGKLVNLPKPLAVLYRPPRPPTITEDDMDEEERSVEEEDVERDWAGAKKEQRGWDVVAVVKKKMVFSKRPMPMVASIPVAPGGSVVKK
ncbi:hypothetical protein EUX98_g1954 [Antrodiella citrinella]|uniref:Chromosome transmission fidelity protein 8 n=1 Tax=Antrodiella citrinella TaxID=2447956 RepID=A0A4V6S1X6_9APHY|nr:hypothetical protein EUX98_g1954 [Antrodiella citrinella]